MLAYLEERYDIVEVDIPNSLVGYLLYWLSYDKDVAGKVHT